MENRLSRLETIVNRLSRRSVKVTRSIITPYPISNAVFGDSVSGSVLRYMFPCSGVISKGLIWIDKKLKNGATLTFKMSSDAEIQTKTYNMNKQKLFLELNMDVNLGDRIDISIEPNSSSEDTPEKITEVWISFLWRPSIDNAEVKNYLINEIEKESKKFLEGS